MIDHGLGVFRSIFFGFFFAALFESLRFGDCMEKYSSTDHIRSGFIQTPGAQAITGKKG